MTMDWFRWHHGSVNDQKFRLVAGKSGASVCEVIGFWACLLEMASAAESRGNTGPLDFESMDYALGMPEGRSQAIYGAMVARKLINEDGTISAWEKRQPKREREEFKTAAKTSTERKRKQREAAQDGAPADAEPCHAMSRHVTPDATMSRHVTPRLDKIREEEIRQDIGRTPYGAQPTAGDAQNTGPPHLPHVHAMKAAGLHAQKINTSHPTFLALIAAGATPEEFAGHVAKALGKPQPFAYVVACVKGERMAAKETAGLVHHGPMHVMSKQDALEAANRRAGEEWLRKETG